MPIARTNLASSWYILENERDQENPTRFHVKPLTSLEFLELTADSRTDDRGNVVLTGAALVRAVRVSLKAWENFYDQDGKAVRFSPHNIGVIPPDALAELAGYILDISAPGEPEKKP